MPPYAPRHVLRPIPALCRWASTVAEVPQDASFRIAHDGEGFACAEFPIHGDALLDGDNEIGFTLREGARVPRSRVMVQEAEARVVPGSHAD